MSPKLKPCLVHGEDPSKCGCPESISQADTRVYRTVAPKLPDILAFAGEKPMEGPITITWETTRNMEKAFDVWVRRTRVLKLENATETRKFDSVEPPKKN